ncbi:polysaccharide export protein [Oscillatoriales cyanobacterium USR001]|nr:polysaccharide export protein [Oscillatoriales cyanobacterium USR001]
MIANSTINILKSLTASTLMAAIAAYPSGAQLPPPPPPLPIPVPANFPSNPGTTSPPPIQSSEVYTLGAGDRIEIDIFNVPEYSGPNGQHQILADGTLSLPLIGNLEVQGMTLEQAADAIRGRYAKYLRRPVINLKLLASRPLQIAIAGEVNRPGAYTVSPTSSPNGSQQIGTQLPTVTRALQMAGGITPSADVRQIKIRRPQRGGLEQIINVNLWELLQGGDLRTDITLRDGDAIYIPTVTNINREENRTLADANFSSENTQPINIAVVGEVSRPGTYTLAKDIKTNQTIGIDSSGNQTILSQNEPVSAETSSQNTVTKAIKMAGGITQIADIRQIQVRRVTRNGTEQNINVNLWELLQNGDITQDIMLQQGDTIIVPKAETTDEGENAAVGSSSFAPNAINISVVGEVLRPGAIAVPPNTSLNQALLAAGGFNKVRANMESVELIRLNQNGTVLRRTVPINFGVAVNEETNPLLRNNDVIMVKRSGRAAFSDRVGGAIAPLSPFLGILRVFDLFR